ncbi:nucleoside phosphorylase [Occultella aeris]|uniref:Uridine phosphorylase n=1 Tax=Occultella aeris TaxID=2761496 RepID=A0A7M4DGS6_9MICO|nr:nucleoside phosphorylase [Occultella aeris]VZO36119.1 Uridine phosphorylase [Occultella aeris]
MGAVDAIEPHPTTNGPDDVLGRYRYAANVPAGGLMIDGRPALTQFDPSRIGRYVLLVVRDPLCAYDEDPAAQFADELDDAELVGRSGMFTTYSGTYKDAPVTVLSGGSGGPEVELALMELFEHTNADTFIRVGGSGGMHASVRPGDLVIATGVVRDEGVTQAYIPQAYPGVCSAEVVLALTQAAAGQGAPFHLGLTRSTDSDFVAGGRPAARGYFQPAHLDLVETWTRAGVLNGDRESAPIVTLASLFGHRGGSICSVADNIVTGARFIPGAGHADAMSVALDGVAVLHAMDRAREAAGLAMWIPALAEAGGSE